MRRRCFLGLSASALPLGAVGAACAGRGRIAAGPRFDGRLFSTPDFLAAAADDWGRAVRRLPAVVLRARTVRDVVSAVSYAREHGMTVAMRGQGHCVSGQAQAPGGLVIDSSPLNQVKWHGTAAVDALPGALWRDVTRTTLAAGRTLPVLPDALVLSVGGTLSAGGTGDASWRAGAQVDHVLEIDVVTGEGRVATCSARHDRELFEMTLGGLGQCGFIVRARLRVEEAPRSLVMRTFLYADAGRLLDDQARLAETMSRGVLAGEITPEPGGGWRVALDVGVPDGDTRADAPPPDWLAALGDAIATSTVPYSRHIDRRTERLTAARSDRRPHPSLAVVLPATGAPAFLSEVLSNEGVGVRRIEVLPMVRERFTRPLHVLPDAPLSFTVRVQREASAAGAADHEAMLESNRRLVALSRAASGKVYPPFAPPLAPDEWRDHFGPALWARLERAKARFDPGYLLTPGPGLFASQAGARF